MDTLIKWAIYGLIATACAATLGLAWHNYVIAPAEARGAARQEAKDAPVITQLNKALSDARQALTDAQAKADATARAYAMQQQAAQLAAEQATEANDARIATLDAQVAKLSDDKRIVLSAYARVVLDDATRTANAAGPAPAAPAGAATGTAAVPAGALGISERQLGEYATRAAAAYADAVTLFHGCRDFYVGLLKGASP